MVHHEDKLKCVMNPTQRVLIFQNNSSRSLLCLHLEEKKSLEHFATLVCKISYLIEKGEHLLIREINTTYFNMIYYIFQLFSEIYSMNITQIIKK